MQRFVDASIIGWYNYLYGDNAAANARIKRDNPEMTDDRIAYSIAKMKEYGIVDSGDAQKLGIGAMTDARMKSFFDKMARAGVVKGTIDYRKSYTLQFVNKGVGLDLRPKNDGVSRIVRMARPGIADRRAARRRQGVRQPARSRSAHSISKSATANSCRCSAPPAAASRRRCASSRA